MVKLMIRIQIKRYKNPKGEDITYREQKGHFNVHRHT